jgi:cytochrome c
MNSFDINKVLGALLGCCLVLLAVNIAAGAIFAPKHMEKPGYEIAVKEEAPDENTAEAPAKEVPIENLLATASVQRGENVAKQCQACHSLEKGGPNKIGPDLWDIVGRARATHPGFNYSAPMKTKGGSWSIDDLNQFLTNPKVFVPGTLMTFQGLPRESQRADVIAYLNTLSDSPQPLPKAAEGGGAATPAEPAKPQPANAGALPNAQPNGKAAPPAK